MDPSELAPLPFLESLTAEQCVRLAHSCRRAIYGAGEQILVEGEPGDEWFGILSGWVRVTRAGVLLGKLGPGRFFGELALLDGVRRNASVTADGECVCAVLGRERFRELLEEAPALAAYIRATATARLRQHAPIRPA